MLTHSTVYFTKRLNALIAISLVVGACSSLAWWSMPHYCLLNFNELSYRVKESFQKMKIIIVWRASYKLSPKESRKAMWRALITSINIQIVFIFTGVAFLNSTCKFYWVKESFLAMKVFSFLREPQKMVPSVPRKAI